MIKKHNFNENCITYSQVNLIFNSRIFWRRFTTWIRVYIISRYWGIGTAEESFGRLYLEATDFGEMLRIIFGRNASNRYTQLQQEFTVGLRELISAQLAGNAEAVQQRVDQLYRNAEDSAAFLASINPYLNEAEWKDMLRTYLSYTIEAANEFALGDYSRDIEIFDNLTNLTNRMGEIFAQALYDYITSGQQPSDNLQPQVCITYDQMNAIYEIRMLWFELATWVRAYMLRRYTGQGDPEEMIGRLRQVAANYANMLRQIFSQKDADTILKVVNDYIDLIEALITAQQGGNEEEIDRITRLLYQNADERAAFLASINPFWDENEWRERLYENLRSTIAESTTFLTGEYAQNLDIFSALLDQAEGTSEYYARGLFDYVRSLYDQA